jgi:hypothetical protein
MSKSVISSIAGHLQIYSDDARDDLALFGGFTGGDDFGLIRDFAPIRAELEKLDNVEAVVPMGLQSSIVMQGNEIDLTLGTLRDAVKSGDTSKVSSLKLKLLNLAIDLEVDLKNRLPIAADRQKVETGLADLQRVKTDAFWEEFAQNPEEQMLFLDTRFAPLAEDGRIYYLRNLGTDVHRFAKLFDRFEMVDGDIIPQGERGILISNTVYEKQIKHRVARDFDKINREVTRLEKTIASDPILEDLAKRLPRQYPRIKNQLAAEDAKQLVVELCEALGPAPAEEKSGEDELTQLLQRFLAINDDNFLRRHELFYELIAPKIRLYASQAWIRGS